ncbi:hypothetical protein [Vibrio sp. Isolate30]|uniref:hypothetical protein n=1 Tax=Vibrio sp. Isolate30 TaxID=2908536 RepID=UPI001EFECEF4|nr:hypothetical protein [Vibrio sp. Isolate30]MCG9632376.1 hypothetical protein [Vibrio sp. Isolate30]
MKNSVLSFALACVAIFGFNANASEEENFWKWFQTNEDMLFNFEKDQEVAFDKLSAALNKVDPNLTFEFSPIREDNKREFVISAGGIQESFSSVELLFATAPNLDNWVFFKFRQRRTPLHDLTYGGVSVKADDVFYHLYKDGDKLGVVLFFDGYNEPEHVLYASIGFLFLDQAIGEYDVETKLSFIEFHNKTSAHYEGAKPLKRLSTQFDDYFGG